LPLYLVSSAIFQLMLINNHRLLTHMPILMSNNQILIKPTLILESNSHQSANLIPTNSQIMPMTNQIHMASNQIHMASNQIPMARNQFLISLIHMTRQINLVNQATHMLNNLASILMDNKSESLLIQFLLLIHSQLTLISLALLSGITFSLFSELLV